MKSKKFQATIGINPGYFHNNEKYVDFEHLLSHASDLIQEETGIYVSWIVYPSKTIYKTEWGCPDGGEVTYSIESTANPNFAPDMDLWIDSATRIIKYLMKELEQSTITITINEVDFIYLTNN